MDNVKAIIRIIGQLNYILTKKQKKESVIVFLSMILCSVLELVGVSVIYPFLQLLLNEESLKSSWYTKWLYDAFPSITTKSIVLVLCSLIILVYLAKNAMTLLCRYTQNRYAASFQRELSTTMLGAFLKRPYEYFLNTNSAMVMQYIHGDTSATYNVLLCIYEVIAEIMTVVLIGVYLLYTDWVIATAALILALTCFIVVVLIFKKKLKQAGKEMVGIAANQTKASYQAIYGIKEISVMDRRECFVEQYNEASKKVERIIVLYNFLAACPDRIIEGVCISGFIGLAALRTLSGLDTSTFIPALGAFAMGAFKILPSISKMSSRINTIVYNQTRLSQCCDNLREVKMLELEQSKLAVEKSDGWNTNERISFNKEIAIDNVTWKYSGTNANVLHDLSLTIKKGEAVALIGASGAGKTTLADIILGLFRPQQGTVYMDGIDIKTIPHSWARTIGYVPQSVFLLDDTIRANIAFGLPYDDKNDNKIWNALEQAQLAGFIRGLPDGLDTIVGERGVKFSGGQIQRVAIARALFENPDILVLDEATSALDTETETAVMQSIDALLGHKTIIIIAHRLSTIRNCDKVYEIKGGKAIERNKYDVISNELMG